MLQYLERGVVKMEKEQLLKDLEKMLQDAEKRYMKCNCDYNRKYFIGIVEAIQDVIQHVEEEY